MVALVEGNTLELILEVKLTVSVLASSPKVTLPLNVDVPETINWSSIVVVPPAESIVRLPDVVSISLSPLIPI